MKLARLAVALTAIAALTACSDDPEPKVEPSETPSSEPTSSPPEAPDPEAAVRAWVDARNVLMLEGDAAHVEALSAPSCRTCRDSIAPLKEVYANGGSFDNDGWKISSARVKSETSSRATVSVALVTSAGTTIPEAGAEPVTYVEERRMAIFRLESSVGWQVSFIGYLP